MYKYAILLRVLQTYFISTLSLSLAGHDIQGVEWHVLLNQFVPETSGHCTKVHLTRSWPMTN